jgi:hypothetical protein
VTPVGQIYDSSTTAERIQAARNVAAGAAPSTLSAADFGPGPSEHMLRQARHMRNKEEEKRKAMDKYIWEHTIGGALGRFVPHAGDSYEVIQRAKELSGQGFSEKYAWDPPSQSYILRSSLRKEK